jgi:hypothetical protein
MPAAACAAAPDASSLPPPGWHVVTACALPSIRRLLVIEQNAVRGPGGECQAPGPLRFPAKPDPATGRPPMKPITVTLCKPRNPLVAAARFRRAGLHAASRHGERQQALRALRRELDHLHRPSP